MSIVSTFNRVKLAADAALKAGGKEPFVLHELGSDHISDAGAAPSVVWELLGAPQITTIAGPMAPVARRLVRPTVIPGVGEAVDTQRISELAQYAKRAERIRIHFWANPRFEDLEILVNGYVALMRTTLSGHVFKPGSTDWTVGQDQKAKGMHVGLFECVIMVPFTFETLGKAAYPLTLTVEGEILDPDEELGEGESI